ncbi:MAG: ATP-binding protein [Tannerella sp.]|jgi:predicted AAA+ superfamily ATPase|nr:ATP-binding protein [Tannerella sp.]
MQRFFENKLTEWLNAPNALPLILVGARQIGKTYLLRQFCENNFEQTIYLNFAETPDYKTFFTPSLNADDIVLRMELFFNQKINIGKTVFFFDEIQDCEQAIASLKYFAESPKTFRIVSAGSLLSVKINRMTASFPVGKVQIEYLYPMDFEEFLWALDEKMLADAIRSHFADNDPLPPIVHNKALELYRTYLCIGGMPATILQFVENEKDILSFNRQIPTDIVTGYLADMTKYADGTSAVKIHKVYRSIPVQLAKEYSRFMYKAVENGGNNEKFGTSIEWLIQANMALRCEKIESPQSPLTAYGSENIFKLYFSDVGLLTSLSKMNFRDILQNNASIYRGFLTENFVAQTFNTHKHNLYYWSSKHLAEIDFVLDLNEGIIPVEVKAAENVRSKSLNVYIEKYKPAYAIRISAKNFGFENNIKSAPLYAAHCVE